MSKNCEASTIVVQAEHVVAAARKELLRREEIFRNEILGFATDIVETIISRNSGFLRRLGILRKLDVPTVDDVVEMLNMVYGSGTARTSGYAKRGKLLYQMDTCIDEMDDFALCLLYSDFTSRDDILTIRRLAALQPSMTADGNVTLSINDAALIGLI